ncbi:MAG: peptidylprolyl isomerase, partial [Ignavibacteriaceae bacterium]|nr:peptidylprolyl isomerase [Ignavibacteriaceae bacterium]
AVVTTEKGSFEIQFLPQYAPISVGSFCYLAQLNFFKGLVFHRVVPGFVIQTGDPTGTGWGGAEYQITSEFSPLNFDIGFVGMASAGKDTEGSQWFVMQGNYPHLDGRYSIFGKIKTGIETVFNTGQTDKILKLQLKY